MSNVGVCSALFDVSPIVVVYGGVLSDQCGGRRSLVVGRVTELTKIFPYDHAHWVLPPVPDVS